MSNWIIYSLGAVLTGGTAILTFLFLRNKATTGKAKEFDASKDLFI